MQDHSQPGADLSVNEVSRFIGFIWRVAVRGVTGTNECNGLSRKGK